MNGQFIVAEQLREYCINTRVDLALVQEPPNRGGRIPGLDHAPIRTIMVANSDPGAAIIVFNPELEVLSIDTLSEKYITVVTIKQKHSKSQTFVSAYFKFNIRISEFITKLTNIMSVVKTGALIAVDSNAHSDLWFSQGNNNTGRAKGRKMEELINDLLLIVHNKPNQPNTYNRTDMGSSNIDVTLSTKDLEHKIKNWTVNTDITDSDHRLISFTVRTKPDNMNERSRNKIRYNVEKADWDVFKEHLISGIQRYSYNDTVEQGAELITDSISRAAKLSIPTKGKPRGKKFPPWWAPELTISGRAVNNFRKNKNYKTTDREQYREVRNNHLSLIRKTRYNQWKEFAESANSNPWGPLYKWLKKGSRNSSVQTALNTPSGEATRTPMETACLLLDTLIPHDGSEIILADRQAAPGVTIEINQDEIKNAIWRIGPKKAPGKDGLTAAILRKAWPIVNEQLTHLYKRCLISSTFPKCWKDADVVALLKGPDKDASEPKSYRPVSLLPTLGKVLETLVINRLRSEISQNLSDEQHGFTPFKSTLSAINSLFDWVDSRTEKLVIGVFLDISGAFDNLKWETLFEDLTSLGAGAHSIQMIKSYLENRSAHLTIENSTASCVLSKGCPQGSQLGPVLWNVSMDKALQLHTNHKVKMIAYADDLVIAVAATRLPLVQERLTLILDRLINWAEERGLTFSIQKTQMITLKGGLKPGYNTSFGNDIITSTSPIRYLGVLLDYKRNFCSHLVQISGKSEQMYSRMRAATTCNWGINQTTSKVIYKAVFIPRLGYAVSVWEKALTTSKAIKLLRSKQRDALRSITGAYKTTSTDALQVIGGCLPLDLELRMLALKEKVRLGKENEDKIQTFQEELLNIWNDRWTTSNKGRWTFKWFPDVIERYWVPLEPDHFTTQFISGHGDFNEKLHSFKLNDSPLCHCGVPESAEHVLFDCPRVEDIRNDLKTRITKNGITWPCDVKVLVSSGSNFEAFRRFAKRALVNRTDR